MKTYMSGLNLKGFKSFNKNTYVEFTPGLNCVVGPNGSGKSNILDALCFTLGRLSTKSIRAENYSDLLYKKKGETVQLGEVVIRLDNSSKVFPVEAKSLELRRKINKQGQTVYYLNGRRATRQQAVDLLSLSKITPDGHNIILQGDIDKFISMSAIDKRRVVEEVAGIYIYEQKKFSALRELGKVDGKLKEARIVLTEKQAYMGSLEDEKKQAEKYLSFETEMKSAKATEIRLRMTGINSKRSEISQKASKIESVYDKFKDEIKQREKKADILNDKISGIEDKIGKKGGEEQLDLQKKIENLRVSVENAKNMITTSKHDINRIDQRKKGLSEQLTTISKELSEKKKEQDALEKEKRNLEQRKGMITKDTSSTARSIEDMERELSNKDQEIDNLKQKKEKITEELQKATANLQVVEYKLNDIREKLGEIDAQKAQVREVRTGKDKYKSIIQKINQLTNDEVQLTKDIAELRRILVGKEDTLGALRVEINSSQEMIMRDKAISVIMKSKKQLKGILGTVSELGQADSQFAAALGVAAGNRMKNIVVENDDVAIRGLALLKQTKGGVATFLPLTKIRIHSTSALAKSVLHKNGVLGLASELVKCDPKYRSIFRYLFRDTLIVQNTNVAKVLGIGKFSMVTLDGDVFSTSGAITGGFRRRSLSFAKADRSGELDTLSSEILKLKAQLTKLEKDKINMANIVIELRGQKAELEGKIGVIKDVADPETLLKEKEKIEKEFKEKLANRSVLDKQLKSLVDRISKEQIRKNAQSAKIKDLKFGKQSKELKSIDSALSRLESKLQALITIIDNVLLPEQKNIQKVITNLDKEKIGFDNQIVYEQNEIKKNQRFLEVKEREEKEFYGTLKSLFAEKNRFAEFLKKEEKVIKEIRLRITGDDEERNALQIAKAKIDAQYTALQEEIEPYKAHKNLPYLKSAGEARSKFKDMEIKIETLGSVNMRALKIYDKAKKDFDQISWRVDRLTKEYTSIVDVINEIELRKKETFMSTFTGISSNFSKIFARISNKMIAKLILENKEKPFDGGIHITVQDQHGKNLFVGSLSGGEKTLVALAFIFAVQEHDPAPFYLLDEIDAALDKVNSEKVAELLQEYSKKAQVVIISHNDAIISAADNLYGVWMNKHGESYVNALKI